jgi:hypothetical protein
MDNMIKKNSVLNGKLQGKMGCDLDIIGELPKNQLQYKWQYSVKKLKIVKVEF